MEKYLIDFPMKYKYDNTFIYFHDKSSFNINKMTFFLLLNKINNPVALYFKFTIFFMNLENISRIYSINVKPLL